MELLDNPVPAAAAQVRRARPGSAGGGAGRPQLPVLQLRSPPSEKFDGSPKMPETPVFAATLKCRLINIHGMRCAVEGS